MYRKFLHKKVRNYLCAILCCMFALPLHAQMRQLKFNSKQVTISSIIDRLQSVYNYKVSYDADVNTAGKINLSSTDLTLGQLITEIEQQAGVGIRNIGGNLVFKKVDAFIVSGTVTSADDGLPLAGVTITNIAKKSLGSTNADGQFTIRITSGAPVSFAMIGFDTFTARYQNADNNVKIKLATANTSLNEVVVTALGIKREEKALGYAATVIQGEDIANAPSNNWTDALSGKVAGLNLLRSNGGPTGSNKIILRGENNLTGENEALIVVDGVVINNGSGRATGYGASSYLADETPVDFGSGLNDINPSDIENITVLKGSNASALYGQRGANGAIIITTKAGSARNKGVNVTINSNFAMESINRWPDLQYEYGQGVDGANYYSYNASEDGASTRSTSSAWGPKFDGQMFYQYDPVTHTKATTRTPWVPYVNDIRNFFETGKTYTNSVTVDGGNDKTTARFSATNVKNSWIIPNTGYDRNTVALSINQKMSDKFQIAAKVNYTNKKSDNLPSVGYNNQSIMYWYMFWEPNANIDWLKDYWLPGRENIQQSYPFSSFPDNPYLITQQMLNTMNRHGVTGNIQATYNFTKELSMMVRTSLDFGYDQRTQQRPWDTEKFRKGMYRTQNIFSQEVTADFLLRYNKKINKDFEISATAGGSTLSNTYSRDELRADSLAYPGIYKLANTAGVLAAYPYKSKYSINSFYGLLTASYKDYLFVDLTARNDWNSVLATPYGTDNVSFFYPGINMSFIPTEVFKFPSFVDYFKVRGSASSTGSGSLIPYRTSYNYQPLPTYPGGALENPSSLANLNLRPLRTISYEAGIEAKFFKNRLGFDLSLYTADTKDQHLNSIPDRSTGVSTILVNAGRIRNRGIELAVNGTPFKVKNGFTWNINGTFTANRNEVLQLLDSIPELTLQNGPGSRGAIIAKVGGSMGDFYGRGYERSPDGQIVYENGYPVLGTDLKYLGNTMPKFRASLQNEFRYNQFSLSFLFDAQTGAVGYSLTSAVLTEQGKTTNTLPGRYNGIIGNGVVRNADGSYSPNTVIAENITTYHNAHAGRDNVEGTTYSTDYLKLREARIDYTLPAKVAKKIGMRRAVVGVYGRDLLIFSDWPAFDPEFGTLSGADINRGFELGQLPSTRTFGMNVTLAF